MSKPRVRATAPRPWYKVGPVLALADPPAGDPAAAVASTADVYVYDTIGGWFGLSADDFVRDVAAIQVDQIVLHLNTPGGDATEGVAIANVLRAHRARIVVRVDGLAASAGSVIAMCGDEIVMGIGSQMMIHDAWGFSQGDAAEMAAAGRMLDSTSDAYAAAYAARAGGTPEQWREVMRAETWYTGAEAVAAGLADRVATVDEIGTAEGEQITPGATSYGGWWDMWDSLSSAERFDLSAYRYPGRDRAPAPPAAIAGTRRPAASAAGPTKQERSRPVAFSDEQLKTMREKLGLAEDADEQAITDAISGGGEQGVETTDSTDTAGTELPAGVVAVSQSALSNLEARASRGDAAYERQQRDDRNALVSAAIGDGRIPPADRKHWSDLLEESPKAATILGSLQKNLIPVGRPIGHGGGDEQAQGGAEKSVQAGRDLYAKRTGKTA